MTKVFGDDFAVYLPNVVPMPMQSLKQDDNGGTEIERKLLVVAQSFRFSLARTVNDELGDFSTESGSDDSTILVVDVQ